MIALNKQISGRDRIQVERRWGKRVSVSSIERDRCIRRRRVIQVHSRAPVMEIVLITALPRVAHREGRVLVPHPLRSRIA